MLRKSMIEKSYEKTKHIDNCKIWQDYIENFEQPDQIEVKEYSLFVVNLNDDPDFVRNVQEMADVHTNHFFILLAACRIYLKFNNMCTY